MRGSGWRCSAGTVAAAGGTVHVTTRAGTGHVAGSAPGAVTGVGVVPTGATAKGGSETCVGGKNGDFICAGGGCS